MNQEHRHGHIGNVHPKEARSVNEKGLARQKRKIAARDRRKLEQSRTKTSRRSSIDL